MARAPWETATGGSRAVMPWRSRRRSAGASSNGRRAPWETAIGGSRAVSRGGAEGELPDSSSGAKAERSEALVPEEGVEPSRPEGHGILSPARLPVSPLRPEERGRPTVYRLPRDPSEMARYPCLNADAHSVSCSAAAESPPQPRPRDAGCARDPPGACRSRRSAATAASRTTARCRGRRSPDGEHHDELVGRLRRIGANSSDSACDTATNQ